MALLAQPKTGARLTGSDPLATSILAPTRGSKTFSLWCLTPQRGPSRSRGPDAGPVRAAALRRCCCCHRCCCSRVRLSLLLLVLLRLLLAVVVLLLLTHAAALAAATAATASANAETAADSC